MLSNKKWSIERWKLQRLTRSLFHQISIHFEIEGLKWKKDEWKWWKKWSQNKKWAQSIPRSLLFCHKSIYEIFLLNFWELKIKDFKKKKNGFAFAYPSFLDYFFHLFHIHLLCFLQFYFFIIILYLKKNFKEISF